MKNKLSCVLFFLIIFNFSFAQTAETAYKAGVFLKLNKKSNDAIKEFKKAIELDPNSVKSMYELGWCFNDTKDYKSAIDILRKVRPYWATVPKVYFELGYAFDELKQIDSAKFNYIKCLQLKPDYSNALKQMAYLEYDKNNYTESVNYMDKYVIVDSGKNKDYMFWYKKGFSENALKKYDNAINSLLKSLEFKKDYVDTYLELGFAKTKIKSDNYGAIQYFQQAITLNKNSHIPYNGIAEVYRDNFKNCDSAIFWYNKSLQVKSNERKACFGIGYCFNAKGKYIDAIPFLQTAILQENNYTAAYVELGYSFYKTQKYDDALINFNKAISINANNENARYYKGLMFIEQKKKLDAQKMVDELKLLNSKNASSLQTKVNAL